MALKGDLEGRADRKEAKLEKILAQAKNHLPKRRATMNVATKTMPWMVASLLAVTSFFGQTQNQATGGCPQPQTVCKAPPKCGPLQEPLPPTVCAYNAPAEINTGMQGDINFFASGSFIYWQPSQDNMNFAIVNNYGVADLWTTTQGFAGHCVEMDFHFKPGFKVGLGMNLQVDDWDGYVEYTRVHGHHSRSTTGYSWPSVYATWGNPFYYVVGGGGQVYQSAHAKYNNHLDFVDAEMARKYYVGKSLLFRSAWGARAGWILQNVHVNYANNTTAVTASSDGTVRSVPSYVDVYSRNHSWGVGPRAGLTMDWLLGAGLRFFGSGYGDILYTKYSLKDKTVLTPLVTTGLLVLGDPVIFTNHDKVGALRTHLDFEAGFGWGSYLDNHNWHFDLSLAYGFQVFFDQNMFRHYEDSSVFGVTTAPNGNLYVQGLTLTTRLDF